jgi:FixJ family two-component response regulator
LRRICNQKATPLLSALPTASNLIVLDDPKSLVRIQERRDWQCSPDEKALYQQEEKQAQLLFAKEKPLPGTVHVVDDDALLRTTIRQLAEAAGYRVITYASAQQFLNQRPDENSPGCILLDVRMAGLSGPELQNRLIELGSTLPVVFLTGYMDVIATVKAIEAGAHNFFIKPVRSDELLKALESAIARHKTTLTLKDTLDALRAQLMILTPRQRRVFEIIVRGKTNKHAARALDCSERTIKAHRQVIMEKMKVQSLAQLVTIAERLGVLRESGPEGQN